MFRLLFDHADVQKQTYTDAFARTLPRACHNLPAADPGSAGNKSQFTRVQASKINDLGPQC
jgi:hypothetical protein